MFSHLGDSYFLCRLSNVVSQGKEGQVPPREGGGRHDTGAVHIKEGEVGSSSETGKRKKSKRSDMSILNSSSTWGPTCVGDVVRGTSR